MESGEKMRLFEELKRLGNIAGVGGKITLSVVCEDGTTNAISWMSEYTNREPMVARAISVLNDGILIKQGKKS